MPLRAPRKDYTGRGGGGGGYSGLGIIATVKEEQANIGALLGRIFARNVKQRIGLDGPSLPLGTRDIPILKPGFGLPELLESGAGEPSFAGTTLPEPIDRRDPPQVQEVVSMQVVNNWFDYHALVKAGIPVKHVSQTAGPYYSDVVAQGDGGINPRGMYNTPKTTTTTGGSMDLGDLLGKGLDLYSQYQDIKYAQPTIQPVGTQTIIPEYLVPDFLEQAPAGLVVKKKPCRRRRKRLATKSDLGDLAALKAILGNGEAFKAWIATHSR